MNKMDKNGADFEHVLDTIRKRLGARPVALQIPIGAEANFKGVIDLVEMKAIVWQDEAMGSNYDVEPVPANLQKKADAFRTQLIETIAETDDVLLEKFLEGELPTIAELKAGIRQATIDLKVFPVICGTAFKNKGIQTLLDAVVDYLPSPLDKPPIVGIDPHHHDKSVTRKPEDNEPLAALAFKIINDPFGKLCFIRVYSGSLRTGDAVLNPRTGKTDRYRAPGEDARQQARGNHRSSSGRYLRLRGSKGHKDRRYTVRAALSDRAGCNHFPGYGHFGKPSSPRPRLTRKKMGVALARLGRRRPDLQGADR